MNKKIFSMLGLAMRAGMVCSGEFSVLEAVKKRKAFLLLIATDTSENSRKRLEDKASYRHIPCFRAGSKEELGRAIGQSERSAAAVLDAGFANKIRQMLEDSSEIKEQS